MNTRTFLLYAVLTGLTVWNLLLQAQIAQVQNQIAGTAVMVRTIANTIDTQNSLIDDKINRIKEIHHNGVRDKLEALTR